MKIPASKLDGLEHIDESLGVMAARLDELVTRDQLNQDEFVELTAIFNNVAYVLVYLAANEEYDQVRLMEPWRDHFYENDELAARIIRLLKSLKCPDSEAEASRLAFLAELETVPSSEQLVSAERLSSLLARAESLLTRRDQDRGALLGRLGIDTKQMSPNVAYYRLLASTESAELRFKLATAWRIQSDRHTDELVNIVDEMVDTRSEAAFSTRHANVLSQTLAKSQVTEDEVMDLTSAYLSEALHRYERLAKEISAEAKSSNEDPAVDFPAYMNSKRGRKTPLYSLEDCLQYAFTVAGRIFGIEIALEEIGRSHVLRGNVSRDGVPVGQLIFDLWDEDDKAPGANFTRTWRNRTEWADIRQLPVAYISCRFNRRANGNGITFQNVHSLLHELGHGLNHILIQYRIPSRSGLEYLPLERVEYLSMWFEKWIYHPAFVEALHLGEADAAATVRAQQLKALEYRRTYVERALCSALDVRIHLQRPASFRSVWHQLDEQFGIARFSSISEIVEYFTWPMYQAHPGANFSYLWGASSSSQNFLKFLDIPESELPGDIDTSLMFAPVFCPDLAAELPDPVASFDFYDLMAGPLAGSAVASNA